MLLEWSMGWYLPSTSAAGSLIYSMHRLAISVLAISSGYLASKPQRLTAVELTRIRHTYYSRTEIEYMV